MNQKKAKQLRFLAREFAKTNGEAREAIDNAFKFAKENPELVTDVMTDKQATKLMTKIIYKNAKKTFSKLQRANSTPVQKNIV